MLLDFGKKTCCRLPFVPLHLSFSVTHISTLTYIVFTRKILCLRYSEASITDLESTTIASIRFTLMVLKISDHVTSAVVSRTVSNQFNYRMGSAFLEQNCMQSLLLWVLFAAAKTQSILFSKTPSLPSRLCSDSGSSWIWCKKSSRNTHSL